MSESETINLLSAFISALVGAGIGSAITAYASFRIAKTFDNRRLLFERFTLQHRARAAFVSASTRLVQDAAADPRAPSPGGDAAAVASAEATALLAAAFGEDFAERVLPVMLPMAPGALRDPAKQQRYVKRLGLVSEAMLTAIRHTEKTMGLPELPTVPLTLDPH